MTTAPATAHTGPQTAALMTSQVGAVPLHDPVVLDGGTDLVSLCRALSARGVTEALVRDGDRLGIFTTTDLRDALLGLPAF